MNLQARQTRIEDIDILKQILIHTQISGSIFF